MTDSRKKPTPEKRPRNLTTDEVMKKLFSPRVLRELKREVKRLELSTDDHDDNDS